MIVLDYKKPTFHAPETKGALRIRKKLEGKGWYVGKIGGGPYTIGWPDFFCCHVLHGHRWIETKVPGRKLRASQVKRFTELADKGEKIYVMYDEKDYMVLFRDNDNWRKFIP
jgi:hypothetical protein